MKKLSVVIALLLLSFGAQAGGVSIHFKVGNDARVNENNLLNMMKSYDLFVTSQDGESVIKIRCVGDSLAYMESFPRNSDGSPNEWASGQGSYVRQLNKQECKEQLSTLAKSINSSNESTLKLNLDDGVIEVLQYKMIQRK